MDPNLLGQCLASRLLEKNAMTRAKMAVLMEDYFLSDKLTYPKIDLIWFADIDFNFPTLKLKLDNMFSVVV